MGDVGGLHPQAVVPVLVANERRRTMTLHLSGPALQFFETSSSLQLARQVNGVVRVRHDVAAVTVMHLGESDITCGAARSILPGRASHDVRSSRNNVASSTKMATHP